MEFFGFILIIYILSYIGMGFAQPIAAIIRLLTEKRFDSTFAIGLKRYLISVVLYFLLMYGLSSLYIFNSETFFFFYMLVLPWAFSIWYMRHVYIWKKKRKNIKAYDTLRLINAPHEDRLLLESYPSKNIHLSNQLFKSKAKARTSKKAIIRQLPLLVLAK